MGVSPYVPIMGRNTGAAATGDERSEEPVVVFRLEGLGAFAIPVAALRAYQVRAHDSDPAGARAPAGFEPVPVILHEDFLCGSTTRRTDLRVDGNGCIGVPGRPSVFDGAEAAPTSP